MKYSRLTPHHYATVAKQRSPWLRTPLEPQRVPESDRFPAQPAVMAERIKALCDARGWGLRLLAYKSGVGQWPVWKIVHEKSQEPSVWTVARIAFALGVSVDYLIGLTNDDGRISENTIPIYPRADDERL